MQSLVPVNGASVPANAKQEINAVFAQSVAEWDVVIDAAYTVDPAVLADLDAGESGMLASFPKNMRDFIQTFKKERDEDKNAYYLFIIPGKQSTRAGFMPFKRQYGFIYPANTNNIARTIAHELAHGAFRLRHTFSPEEFIAGQGSTKNLMDYPAGPELRKYQWDNVHEPESMSGWFEDDAEVAYYNASVIDTWKKNLFNLACASSRGESLADINVFYELAKGKDSDGFRHPIKFEFYNSIEVEVKVYQLPAMKEYVLDLSTKSKVMSNGKAEISYGLKGTTSKVYFVINSNDAPLFESTISTPPSGLFQQLVDNIPVSEGNAAYSVLSSLPACAFELISAKKRIEYIDWMVQDEWITNEHQEDLIIRLLEEVPTSRVAELVTALESYSNWQDLFENFDNVNTHQGLFRAFMNLYNAAKAKNEREEIKAVFDFNLLKSASLSMDYTSKVDVAYSNSRVQIIREITTAQWTPYGLQNAATKSIPVGDLDVFAPVAVIVNDDHTNIGLQPGTELRSIPAILVAFFIEKKDSEKNKELASTAMDIGLLIGGVGEISGAISAYQKAKTVRTLFRLTLATADLTTVYVDLACQSNDAELCQQWKEVAFYVQIGLLTFNAADGLQALIKRSNVVKGVGSLDEAFESIASVQNLKKLTGVSVKKIGSTELKELADLKKAHQIDPNWNVAKLEVVTINKVLKKSEFTSHAHFDNFQSKIPNGSPSPNQNSKVFNTSTAPTERGTLIPRHNDAEVKVFEDIASQLGAKKGDVGTKVFSDVEGKIKLKTELCPCGSCSGVIEQFKNMFPKVELEILAQPKSSF